MNIKMLLELEKQVVGIYDYADFVHVLGVNVSYIYTVYMETTRAGRQIHQCTCNCCERFCMDVSVLRLM